MVYRDRKNMIFLILSFFSLGGGCLKISPTPLKVKNKIVRIIGFMVFKSTGTISRFQRTNRFWKICNESQDNTKKLSKIGLPNQTSKIWHILADISGLGQYFLKPIFALKPWAQAGRFEYHEAYKLKKKKLSYKGGHRYLRRRPP